MTDISKKAPEVNESENQTKKEKRKKIIIQRLINDGSKLSLKTLDKISDSMEPLFGEIEDSYLGIIVERDNTWLKAMRQRGITNQGFAKIRNQFNKLWTLRNDQ